MRPSTCRSARDGRSGQTRHATRDARLERLADPGDLGLVDLDLPLRSLLREQEDTVSLHVAGRLRVPRDHVAVEVRETLAHRDGVNAKGAGDLPQHALEVAQGRPEAAGLGIVEAGRLRAVAAGLERQPAGHAVRRRAVPDNPEVVLE